MVRPNSTKVLYMLVCIVWLSSFTGSNPVSPSFIQALSHEYVKSFGSASMPPQPIKKVDTKKKKHNITHHLTKVNLSEANKRMVVFNDLFAHSVLCNRFIQETPNLLNNYAWTDLHLFHGTYNARDYHLLSRINRTKTTLGEVALAILLAKPTNSIEDITQRQQSIDFFNRQPEIHQQIQEQLTQCQAEENSLLSFWSDTDPLSTKEYTTYMDQKFYTKKAAINQSPKALQWRKVFKRDVLDILFKFVPVYPLLISGVARVFVSKKMLEEAPMPNLVTSPIGQSLPIYCFFDSYKWFSAKEASAALPKHFHGKIPNSDKYFPYGVNALTTGRALWSYYKGYAVYKEYAAVLRNLASRMASVQTLLKVMEGVDAIVQNNASLEKIYGKNLTAIRSLLNQTHENEQVNYLIANLKSMPLQSWSYFFNHGGKLLASYKVFMAHKAVFHDAMYELGRLDAFLGIATLIQETKAKGGHVYNFVKLLPRTQKKEPYIHMTEIWNPLLDPTIAIGNSVTMNGATGGMRNLILTGPNAGGKSTFLTSIADSILLSQVFGIAPAKEAVLTPFDRINTYIQVNDDIVAGKSLFMAEVDRFKQHLQLLNALKNNEFSFSIFDEPFSGTNPTEGSAAEYSILNYIANYTNTLNLVATHYPIVMLLEKRSPHKGFKNYKVVIKDKKETQKIEYTYKVIPGESNQAIAIDILQEQGYALQMLEEARDIIENPDKYKKSFK